MNEEPPHEDCGAFKDWIQTMDGKQFFPEDPKPTNISFDVLVEVMSRIVRYSGHCRIRNYTILDHSLHVGRLLCEWGRYDLWLPGLLHDAHEAYTGFGDVARPVKKLVPEIKKIEERVDEAIALRFCFNPNLFYNPMIKLADNKILATEKRDIMGPEPTSWGDLPKPVKWKATPYRFKKLRFRLAFQRAKDFHEQSSTT